MENIEDLVGKMVKGANGEDRKIVSVRYVGTTVELKTEEVMKVSNKKVILDIGHGGTKTTSSGKKYRDFGAENSKSKVDEFTWNEDFVRRYIVPELNKQGITNQIVLRRIGPSSLVQDLNRVAEKGDIILSFHLNSGKVDSTGTETLYWHTSTNGKRLAGIIQAKLIKVLELKDRGIKIRRKPLDSEDALNQRGWEMFRDTKVPYVMLESFFISNDNDLKVGNEKKLELSKAVVEAIKEYNI